MLRILNRTIKIMDKVYVSLAIVLMMVLIINITLGIVTRYFFNLPFTWTEELAVLLFIYISFLAAAVAAARKRFLVVDYFVAKIHPSVQTIIGLVSGLLTIVFLAMVMIGGVLLLPRMLIHSSVALNIPRAVYFVPVILSSILIFFVSLESLIQKLGSFFEKKNQEISP